jgi:exosome complex RNA-binding protein Rrp42 (RNase PH superfamily)
MLACLASWMSFKIPFLRKSGTKIDLTNVSKAQQINLSTLHVPLSVTFGLYDNNSKYIVDPNLKEEQCIDGVIIISANKFNEICYLHTYGSVKVDQETVSE